MAWWREMVEAGRMAEKKRRHAMPFAMEALI
jgi:hypothetical protein